MPKYNVSRLILLFLLAIVMLAGCGKTEPTTTTNSEPATSSVPTDPPIPDPVLYWNLEKGTERTADADGIYTVSFFRDGQTVQLKVASKLLMTQIDSHEVCGLSVDESGTVVSMTSVTTMSGATLAANSLVQNVKDGTITINTSDALLGQKLTVSAADNVKVWDMTGSSQALGSSATLQIADLVTVLSENGKITNVFVTAREGTYKTEKRYCEKCQAEVDFQNWFYSKMLPFAHGHYYLEADMALNITTEIYDTDITLDLNGKTVTQNTAGEKVYWMKDGATLTIMDSVGTGTIIPATSGQDSAYVHKKGLIVRMESGNMELNIYGGTFDATGKLAQHGTCLDNVSGTLNIYGGTFLGGSTYGAGGGIICVQGETNIYGGTFTGGHVTATDFETKYTKGGGCIYVGGTGRLSIYGGTIQNGKSDYNGGTILSNGTLTLHTGTVIGGEAAGQGNAIYVSSFGTLGLCGNIQVEGTMATDPSATFFKDDNCPLNVTREPDGTITQG